MEDREGENLDGSSIKPVSSLRSHFEQMANSTHKKTPPPSRPISPKPRVHKSDTASGTSSTALSLGQNSLRPPGSNCIIGHAPLPSPTRLRPTSNSQVVSSSFPPAVTIEPPSSPPKSLNLNLAVASPAELLTADGIKATSNSPALSPRHFRIPSRPQTPLSEPRKSSTAASGHPPEPPPPRRSGEFRRDTPAKPSIGPPPGPPPINRADKPKAYGNQSTLGHVADSIVIDTHAQHNEASPLHTPPSADSSPGLEPLPRPPSGAGIVGDQLNARSRTPVLSFEPPPVHHSVAELRKDQDANVQSRRNISPQAVSIVAEQRPALPVRPPTNASPLILGRTSVEAQRPPKVSIGPNDMIRLSQNEAKTSRANDTEPALSKMAKRNFSTPLSQPQAPQRTHERSMTLDQMGDRVSADFRAGGKLLLTSENQKKFDSSSKMSIVSRVLPSVSSVEYPDTSFSNRRPPLFKRGPVEISTRYDTRLFDVSGEYVCTSGYHTRVWSLRDGEQVMNLAHGETIKILSIAFKPAASPDSEGSRMWLGNNIGELLEVKSTSQTPVMATNNTAHNRREIVKIYRHAKEMWTLDESGTLHLWGPDGTGTPNLEIPSATYRVPKGHSFSMVVRDELWYATGTDIRVYTPTIDGRTQFQNLQKPLSQPGIGEVTAGAVISNQPERVYFGHSDGKVSIYSSGDYTCVGTVNVSMYKINSMTGVGQYLWAAYNTGMIYVYDTTTAPWVVKKDWRAHANPVINIVADRSSFWKLERLQVISLGADNILRLWDGLLEDDWLESQLQAQEDTFCELKQIKALVMTWNAGASTPHSLRSAEQDKTFFPSLLQESDTPDILVFCFQELVDLEDKKTTAKSLFSKSKKKDPSEQEHMSHQYRDWRDYIIRCLYDSMPRDEPYHLLHSTSLVGLFTCVFVRARLRSRIKGISAAEVKRGMGGRAGNKGALILRFMVDDTSLCFVNCHLAAGQNQTKDRNFDVSSILDSTILPVEEQGTVRLDSYIGGGDGTMILDHEICVLSGDLNYRIDTMSREAVIGAIRSGKLDKLLDRDQLLASRRKRPGFRLRSFNEMPITFAPTYKYDVGTDNYDTSEKRRAPAWCDRILFRGRDRNRIEQLDYRRHEVRVSDHRPVTGLFRMIVKRILHDRRAIAWKGCTSRFEEVKQSIGTSARLDFLMNICGLGSEISHRMLAQLERHQ